MSSSLHKCISKEVSKTIYLYDETFGVFTELIHPNIVLKALSSQEDRNIGKLDDPSIAKEIMAIHSLQSSSTTSNEIAVEVDNATTYTIRIRWMDEKAQNNPNTHQWIIEPLSTWIQWSKPGHLFIVTIITNESATHTSTESSNNNNEEVLIGAFRTLKALPSGWPQCILIQQQEQQQDDNRNENNDEYNDTGKNESSIVPNVFYFETILTDETKQDGLQVAAALLDPVLSCNSKTKTLHTLKALHTICQNILDHPNDVKFRTLKLSNHRVQNQIVHSQGAMYLLHLLGFQLHQVEKQFNTSTDNNNDNDTSKDNCLTLPNIDNDDTALLSKQVDLLQRTINILDLLLSRADTNFVAELATPVPWQPPVLSTVGGTSWQVHHGGTQFLTPDERWDRIDRIRRRQGGGRPRHPQPGHAPSSRGAWGR